MKAGIDIFHTCSLPVAEHFEREARRMGYATGVPNEYRMLPYRHQLPGGMTGTLINQLDEYGMPERFPEAIDEIVRVREELGQPIMATPSRSSSASRRC